VDLLELGFDDADQAGKVSGGEAGHGPFQDGGADMKLPIDQRLDPAIVAMIMVIFA
jgi:hypothetical protein